MLLGILVTVARPTSAEPRNEVHAGRSGRQASAAVASPTRIMILRVAGVSRTGGMLLAAALIFVSGVVGGCGVLKSASAGGSSGVQTGGSTSAEYVHAVKFADCMRAHRVPQFPDPQNPGGFSSAAIDALNTSSPAFVSATNACDRLLPNEGQPTPTEFEQAVVDGVKVARCLRAHGVKFPIPGSRAHTSRSTSRTSTRTLQRSRSSVTSARRRCTATRD